MTGQMSCNGLGNAPTEIGIEGSRTRHCLLLYLLVPLAREDLGEAEHDCEVGRARLDRGSKEFTSPFEVVGIVFVPGSCEQSEPAFATQGMRRFILAIRPECNICSLQIVEEEAQTCTQQTTAPRRSGRHGATRAGQS